VCITELSTAAGLMAWRHVTCLLILHTRATSAERFYPSAVAGQLSSLKRMNQLTTVPAPRVTTPPTAVRHRRAACKALKPRSARRLACLSLTGVARIRWVLSGLETSGGPMNDSTDAVRADLAWVAADFASLLRSAQTDELARQA